MIPAIIPQFRGSPHHNGLEPTQGAHDRIASHTLRPGPWPVSHTAPGCGVVLAHMARLHDRSALTGGLLDLRAHLELDPGVGELVGAVTVPSECLFALGLGQPLDLLLVPGNLLPCGRFLPLAIPVDPLQSVRELPLFLRLPGECVRLRFPIFNDLPRAGGRHWRRFMALLGNRPLATGLMWSLELNRCHERCREFMMEKNPSHLPSDARADGEDCRCNAGNPDLAYQTCADHMNLWV